MKENSLRLLLLASIAVHAPLGFGAVLNDCGYFKLGADTFVASIRSFTDAIARHAAGDDQFRQTLASGEDVTEQIYDLGLLGRVPDCIHDASGNNVEVHGGNAVPVEDGTASGAGGFTVKVRGLPTGLCEEIKKARLAGREIWVRPEVPDRDEGAFGTCTRNLVLPAVTWGRSLPVPNTAYIYHTMRSGTPPAAFDPLADCLVQELAGGSTGQYPPPPIVLDFSREATNTASCRVFRSNIEVTEFQIVSVRAGGELIRDPPDNRASGPNGYHRLASGNKSIIEDIPQTSLICRIESENSPQESGRWIYCGDAAHGTASADGKLQFALNDTHQTELRGEFQISVSVGDVGERAVLKAFMGSTLPWADYGSGAWEDQFSGLPDCPCTYREVRLLEQNLDRLCAASGFRCVEKWDSHEILAGGIAATVSGKYHPYANYDVRWWSKIKLAGQQCIYDAYGTLITSGAGAGTPDRYSPNKRFEGSVVPLLLDKHTEFDVSPFQELPVAVYLEYWKPNPGVGCNAYEMPPLVELKHVDMR